VNIRFALFSGAGGSALPEMSDSWDVQNGTIPDDDAEIIVRCRQGDKEAFALLVRRHQKKMLNIAYRMIGNYDEACDIVQEGFLSAYRAIGRFRGEARFSTWLCGIVVNHARTYLQQRAVQKRRLTVSLDDPASEGNEGLQRELSDPAISVHAKMEKRQLAERIQECLDRIDGDRRQVLILRDIQGLSYDEIGAALRLPRGTVRSRLFRARNELKDRLLKIFGELL